MYNEQMQVNQEMYQANTEEGWRVYINQGGTSSGKTYTILQILCIIAFREKCIVTCVGQDIPNLKVGAFRDAKNIISSNPALSDHTQINESDRIVKFSSGAIIEFKSYDNAQDAKSGKRDYLFINEANGITYEVYWELAIRTRKKIWLDYNPNARFWVHEKVKGGEGVKFIRSWHIHNHFLTEEEHKRIEGIDDPQLWDVYARGKTGHITGLIFNNWDMVDNIPPMNEWKADVHGMDFGFTNDPTALIHLVLAHGELWVDQVIYESGLTNPDIARLARERGITRQNLIIADSAEPKSIAELQRMGLFVQATTKGKDSILNGIDILKRYKIHITRRSRGVAEEFGKYKWKVDRDGNTTNQPIDAFNHAIDALRYGALRILGIRSNVRTHANVGKI